VKLPAVACGGGLRFLAGALQRGEFPARATGPRLPGPTREGRRRSEVGLFSSYRRKAVARLTDTRCSRFFGDVCTGERGADLAARKTLPCLPIARRRHRFAVGRCSLDIGVLAIGRLATPAPRCARWGPGRALRDCDPSMLAWRHNPPVPPRLSLRTPAYAPPGSCCSSTKRIRVPAIGSRVLSGGR